MGKYPARNHNKQITLERAKLVVENAPNYDRDVLVAHVRDALQDAYDDGKRDAAPEARETALREALAIARGFAQDANSRTKTLELELAALLKTLGKTTII